ncbi:MAG: WYL domain-containing protein [Myxococcales bacterium]|nr:WYL domain-containing protein [Myxococcales bacterium]
MNTAARRDRLLCLLYRGATTVPAVADTLGVSVRTAYRDISCLRDAGHDIRATPGPGGGVRIASGSRPRAVRFEVAEVIGLALSVAVLRATPNMPFSRSAEAALDRARRALPRDRQQAIQRLQRRILIGVPSSERTVLTVGEIDDVVLSVFERCFTGARVMAFDYVDRSGVRSSRQIECIALVHHAPIWYVVAWDLDKDASRIFRLDRISAPSCGPELVRQHLLAEVTGQAARDESADDAWGRTPIG